jgi:hypothetical protein
MALKQDQEREQEILNALQTAINNDLLNAQRYDLDSMGTYNDKDNMQ